MMDLSGRPPTLLMDAYLAPMAGVTDIAFRRLCQRYGAITCTEMFSARALKQNPAHREIIKGEGVQLVGNEPEILKYASSLFPAAGFAELNAGCPVRKVVRIGQGAALLKDLSKLRECLEALGEPSVKIRVGWSKNELPKIAEAINGAASRVVVHARTAEQGYSGKADWAAIGQAVKLFDCPVVGNGDVRSYADAKRMLDETGCAGVMIGRAAMANPLIFKAIAQERDFVPEFSELASFFKEYASATDAPFAEVRNHAAWLCHGFRGAPRMRDAVMKSSDIGQISALLEKGL